MQFFRLNAIRGLSMVLGIVASACFARSAEASCGDWLAGHETMRHAADASESPSPERPCQGPSCQGNVPLTPPTPAPQFRPVSQDFAFLMDSDRPILDVGCPATVETAAHARAEIGCDIFRPPRLV